MVSGGVGAAGCQKRGVYALALAEAAAVAETGKSSYYSIAKAIKVVLLL